MTQELIPRKRLEESDTGIYFLTNSKIHRLNLEFINEAEDLLHVLVNENPDFYFDVWREPNKSGINIAWRKI